MASPRALRSLLLALLLLALAACNDPSPTGRARPPSRSEAAQLVFDPAPDEAGRVRPSVRMRIELGRGAPLRADAARPGHLWLIAGGADEAEVAELTHGHPHAALRERAVPLFTWLEPPSGIWVQPARLDAGRHTLVLLVDRKAPLVTELAVDDGPPPPPRAWPLGERAARAGEAWTYCAEQRLPDDLPEHVETGPAPATMRVVRRVDAPCVDLVPDSPLSTGSHVPPPALGGWSLDPSPVAVDPAPRTALSPASCRAGDVPLGPLCVRVDDDRVAVLGAASPTLLLGTVADRPIAFALDAGARVVVRGLPLRSHVELALTVRDGAGETPVRADVTLTAPHRHLVVNEVLARPPSGSPSQRFVELVNDADRPANLSGLVLLDGLRSIALPPRTVPPGAFVLITPTTFVDGLGGDATPAPDTQRIVLDALKLSGEVAVTDDEGRVLSWFPASAATRTVSRGRRTPDRPDDAADAFGFDANGSATPGAANEIE